MPTHKPIPERKCIRLRTRPNSNQGKNAAIAYVCKLSLAVSLYIDNCGTGRWTIFKYMDFYNKPWTSLETWWTSDVAKAAYAMACSNISCCVISGTVNLIDAVLCTMPHQLLGVRLWIVCSTDLLNLLFSLPPIPYFLCMLYVFANWPSDCLLDCMVACFACAPTCLCLLVACSACCVCPPCSFCLLHC